MAPQRLARVSSGLSSRVGRTLRVGGAIALVGAFASCGRTPAAPPVAQSAATSTTTTAGGTIPHGDHNPHHGGVVLMKGDDLHYEVVLDPTGRAHRVYFTDGVREDLPASIASDVVVTVRRPDAPDERIALQIDDAGESWVGSGRAVTNPAATAARVAFAIRQEPYWIDLPFAAKK